MSRFKSFLIINSEKDARYTANLAAKLTQILGKKRLEGLYVVMAVILYYLQRHEQKFDEFFEKMQNITDKQTINTGINLLITLKYTIKSEDMYRVNVEKLL
jgi:hypothetical protein